MPYSSNYFILSQQAKKGYFEQEINLMFVKLWSQKDLNSKFYRVKTWGPSCETLSGHTKQTYIWIEVLWLSV